MLGSFCKSSKRMDIYIYIYIYVYISLFLQLKNMEESIEFINSRPKPLALYAFTKNEAFKRRILSETSSGSVTFNDIMVQVLCSMLFFSVKLLAKKS